MTPHDLTTLRGVCEDALARTEKLRAIAGPGTPSPTITLPVSAVMWLLGEKGETPNAV